MFWIAFIASGLAINFFKVSLSTLTRIADSHLRAGSVAEVPDWAMSSTLPVSTGTMFELS